MPEKGCHDLRGSNYGITWLVDEPMSRFIAQLHKVLQDLEVLSKAV